MRGIGFRWRCPAGDLELSWTFSERPARKDGRPLDGDVGLAIMAHVQAVHPDWVDEVRPHFWIEGALVPEADTPKLADLLRTGVRL